MANSPQGLIPMLGATGAYALNAPFQNDLLPNTNYSCVAIRELREIVASGGDPFTDYYAPKSIDKSHFTNDSQNGVCIISLQAADNSIVNVPSSYIASYPDGGGVPYRVMALSIKLGSVPDDLDLSVIATKVQNDVKDIIGVDKPVSIIALSNVTLISQDDAARLEAARKANIAASDTDHAQLLAVTAERDAALQKIQELEAYIITQNGGTPPQPPDTTANPSPSSP
jgi:hypothetical protein